jgi:hypothetical protein
MGQHNDPSGWKPAMFLTSAEYFETQGFKEGRGHFSRETVWCVHRNQEAPIVLDAFGNDVSIDDP